MAAPKAVKTFTIPPPVAKTTFAVNPKTGALSYQQLQDLWVKAGGSPAVAPLMAAIALAESGGSPLAANENAQTQDDSHGLWQINYYGPLAAERTAKFGPKDQITDPLKNAKAAVALYGDGKGLSNWKNDAAYKAYTTQGVAGLNAFLATHEAKLSVQESTDLAQAQAASPGYVAATTDLTTIKAEARAQAEATAHVADGTQWVVEQKNKIGDTIGFSYSTGSNPPKNVLLINGAPATKNDLSASWNSQYADTYAQFTGKQATPAQISKILASGVSVYGLRSQLATQPAFTTSPVYKSSAAGLQGDAKTILGGNAPQSLINQALAENWDQATYEAKLRALPAYTKGPEFQTNVSQMTTTYQGIYGTPDANAEQTIKESAAAGWSTDQFATFLRAQPEYKTSLEYSTNATNFLDAMGLLTGARPTLKQGKPVTGGSTVPNSPLVPGAPSTLTSPQALKPALAGSQGLAA